MSRYECEADMNERNAKPEIPLKTASRLLINLIVSIIFPGIILNYLFSVVSVNLQFCLPLCLFFDISLGFCSSISVTSVYHLFFLFPDAML